MSECDIAHTLSVMDRKFEMGGASTFFSLPAKLPEMVKPENIAASGIRYTGWASSMKFYYNFQFIHR